MTNLAQQRICVEKTLKRDNSKLNKMRKNKKVSAAFWTSKLWPEKTDIKIAFLEEPNNIDRTSLETLKSGNDSVLDPLQIAVQNMNIKDAIKKIVAERIQPIIGLTIEFVNKIADANVRISFDKNGGAWSFVGTDALAEKTGPTMNFGWFDVPTVIHEFGHMLGMIHEHQNPRGESIDWNEPKVLQWAKETQGWDEKTTKENILEKYSVDTINGSGFDPESIMLYFFPADLTLNNRGTNENLRLSGSDVFWINKQYPNSKITPEEFYKHVYNEQITDTASNSQITRSKTNYIKIFMYILIALIAIFVLYKLLS